MGRPGAGVEGGDRRAQRLGAVGLRVDQRLVEHRIERRALADQLADAERVHAALGEIEAHLVLPGGLESLHREGLDAHAGEYTGAPQMREELLPRFVDLPAGEIPTWVLLTGRRRGVGYAGPGSRVLVLAASDHQPVLRGGGPHQRPRRRRRRRLVISGAAGGRGRFARGGRALSGAGRAWRARARCSCHGGPPRRRCHIVRGSGRGSGAPRASAARGRGGGRWWRGGWRAVFVGGRGASLVFQFLAGSGGEGGAGHGGGGPLAPHVWGGPERAGKGGGGGAYGSRSEA